MFAPLTYVFVDHRNIQTMLNSKSDIVQRWGAYVQKFHGLIVLHVERKHNQIPDDLNHIYDVNASYPSPSPSTIPLSISTFLPSIQKKKGGTASTTYTLDEACSLVHGTNGFTHCGSEVLWERLNKYFPGHHWPFELIKRWVNECPVCQKLRVRPGMILEPRLLSVRSPFGPAHKQVVAIDFVYMTPKGIRGNIGFYLLVKMDKCFPWIVASDAVTAAKAASALIQVGVSFGFDPFLCSDMGSDFTSETIKELNRLTQMQHEMVAPKRHQGNPAESYAARAVAILQGFAQVNPLAEAWDEPNSIALINNQLVSDLVPGTQFSPRDAMLGPDIRTLPIISSEPLPNDHSHWTPAIAKLRKFILLVEASMNAVKMDLRKKRLLTTPEAQQNYYKVGEYVLYHRVRASGGDRLQRGIKSNSPNEGPFRVESQTLNTVTMRDLVTSRLRKEEVTALQLWSGTEEEAQIAAEKDHQQSQVQEILQWSGEVNKRQSLSFLVLYKDGVQIWQRWSQDLFDTMQFSEFVSSRSMLFCCRYGTMKIAQEAFGVILRQPLSAFVTPGQLSYVDIRCYFNQAAFADIGLPSELKNYVVEYRFAAGSTEKSIAYTCAAFGERGTIKKLDFIYLWCRTKDFDELTMVLVDARYIVEFPRLLGDDTKSQKLLKSYQQSFPEIHPEEE